MTTERVPLGILDLVPVSSGSTPAQAIRNSIELARTAERLGYRRYWFAEHHLNPGVAGSSPALLIAMAGAATDHIRLGSGGVQSGHRTALSVVEDFGLLDAFCPGRIDLGIGRSGGRDFLRNRLAAASGPKSDRPPPRSRRTENGLLIPAPPSLGGLAKSPRISLTTDLLQQRSAESADYGELIEDILGLLDGSYRSSDGLDPHPVPGVGAQVEPWILGSSAGESAEVAGKLGVRFAASYHISPATALGAAEAYREFFTPSQHLERPYLAVSADVIVGPDDESARKLAAAYRLWVRSIRRGEGAMPFPGPDEARRHLWDEDDLALVQDRVDTQFVGSPATVAEQLTKLQDATRADELIVTTITHSHVDRSRSFSLLAQEWFGGVTGPRDALDDPLHASPGSHPTRIGPPAVPTRPEPSRSTTTKRIAVVVGNPKAGSRTLRVAKAVAEALRGTGESARDMLIVDLADVAPHLFDSESSTVKGLLDDVANSALVVVASPTYKATYTGLLKSFLDGYNGNGLAGTVCVPLMTGASPVHALAPEVHLRPLLLELGASVPSRGLFVVEEQFDDLDAVIASWASVAQPLVDSVLRFGSSSAGPGPQ